MQQTGSTNKDSIKYSFSESEYVSLRNESNVRIGDIHSQAYTALFTIISAWAAGITFEIKLISAELNYGMIYEEFAINFLRAFFFLLPVFIILPLAVKCGENLTQTASISAYIRVFYEYPLSGEKDNRCWETLNGLLGDVYDTKPGKKINAAIRIYNSEYVIMSLASLGIYALFGILDLLTISIDVQAGFFPQVGGILWGILYIALFVLAVWMILLIRNSSSVQTTIRSNLDYYLDGYLQCALKMGVLTPEQLEDAEKKLDPGKGPEEWEF